MGGIINEESWVLPLFEAEIQKRIPFPKGLCFSFAGSHE
jgi:hypothetical protein